MQSMLRAGTRAPPVRSWQAVRQAAGLAADPACFLPSPMSALLQDDGAPLFAQLEANGPVPGLTPAVREALLKNIKRRMTPQPLKVGCRGAGMKLCRGKGQERHVGAL